MEKIGVTPGHKFWVAQQGWIAADNLQPGTMIETMEGGLLKVSHGWVKTGTATTYNFEVEDYHTYFVGASEAWVHNTGCGKPRPVNDVGSTTNCYHVTAAALCGSSASELGMDSMDNGQLFHSASLPDIVENYKKTGVSLENPVQINLKDPVLSQMFWEKFNNLEGNNAFSIAYEHPGGSGHVVVGVKDEGQLRFIDFQPV